jgi:hypothetical protein
MGGVACGRSLDFVINPSTGAPIAGKLKAVRSVAADTLAASALRAQRAFVLSP